MQAVSYLPGNTVRRTTVSDTTVSAGRYAGGVGAGYTSVQDCTVSNSVITGTSYIGGALGTSYNSTINSTGVVDSQVGSDVSSYVGGLVGGNYQDSSIQCFAYIYNSFSKDTEVKASTGSRRHYSDMHEAVTIRRTTPMPPSLRARMPEDLPDWQTAIL